MHNNNVDFLTQSLKIFEKYMEEFQESYTNFLEISKVANDNIEIWMSFPDFYEEIKEKSEI